ncbi:MAG: hypothetical protein NTZ05_01890 [Chloroflexi bacterium]|nr:hypothetical protein [Chloroflexota bacterium]
MRRVQADGVPVVALNAAVGNLEPAHMAALADVFREAAAVGYHGYVPNQLVYQMSHPDNTYFLQRPIKMWAPALGDAGTPLDRRRLLFTETGTQLPPSPGMHPIEYAALLVAIQEWAEMVGIGGTAAFTLSAHEPWRTEQPFEFIGTDTAHFLAYHNRNHPSAPPLISIPQAQASPADPIEHHGGPAGPPEREIIVVNADEKPFEAGPGINDLAAQLGEAVVGTPNMDEEYIGDRLSLQFRDLDDGAEGVIMHYLDNNGRHHQLFFAGRS